MATHSSILAWRIPWMEHSGGIQSTGLQSDLTERQTLSLHFHPHWKGSLWGSHLSGRRGPLLVISEHSVPLPTHLSSRPSRLPAHQSVHPGLAQ